MSSINNKKNKALFIHHYSTTAKFVTNDITILKDAFDVDVYVSKSDKGLSMLLELFRQFFHHLFNFHKYKIIYIWFADYHSFFPVLFGRIFNKKVFIAIGGYEASYVPEIDMGVFTDSSIKRKIRKFYVIYSLKNSYCLLPVDESLIENINTYIYSDIPSKEPLKDGIKTFIPDIHTDMKVIPPGFSSNIFMKLGGIEKKKLILCVGYSPNDNEFRRKGFDMLIKAAGKMREIKFVLIGLNKDQVKKITTLKLENITAYESVSYDKLIKFYSEAKVFGQLSLFEGLPSTLCEAMMCECIPVGSNIYGIPKVINGTGFIVYKKDVTEIVDKLYQALNSSNDLGRKAREHIINNFSLEKRRVEILKAVSNKFKT